MNLVRDINKGDFMSSNSLREKWREDIDFIPEHNQDEMKMIDRYIQKKYSEDSKDNEQKLRSVFYRLFERKHKDKKEIPHAI